jgi:hypothetical protein
MHSLGRLVRGLSALFWGLPAAFLVSVYATRADGLRLFGIFPSMACMILLVYGLWQLVYFQPQERIWRAALDRTLLLGIINLGLSPFIFWANRVPTNLFFHAMVLTMACSGLLFLASLNQVVQRLGAMLPDEVLKQETRQFTLLNINLLFITLGFALAYIAVDHLLLTQTRRPLWLTFIVLGLDKASPWFLILLVLLPLAMTMALLWKTKEVIMDNVFGARP